MFKKNNRYNLLKVFLDNPLEEFRLRELGRESKLSPASVLNYLKEFEKEGLVQKYEKRGIPFYKAERESERFILYKKLGIIYELEESGLVEYLWQGLSPDAIILFGSSARGESIESSDVDIFIIGKEKKIDISGFERKISKEIQLLFEEDPKKIKRELKNNLLNGVVLRGYFKAL